MASILKLLVSFWVSSKPKSTKFKQATDFIAHAVTLITNFWVHVRKLMMNVLQTLIRVKRRMLVLSQKSRKFLSLTSLDRTWVKLSP